ncbi:hypothetical protein [Sulfurimonas microaerophilic]|nr:hypothetical protein [Sulfurimonas sp. hsl 1-7]
MTEGIEQATRGGDLLIWGIIFTLLVIVVGTLAWIDRNSER